MASCYMCDRESTSYEHVPPRCLFPEQKDLPAGMDLRKSLLTVPSCDLHNSRKSSDDEYLLYCLVLSLPSNEVGKNQFFTKLLRAVERNPSLIGKYLAISKHVHVENLGTKEWSETIACEIDIERINKSLEQLTRALYFSHFGQKASGDIGIYPNFLLAMSGKFKETNNGIKKMDEISEVVFSEQPFHGANPEVFKYRVIDRGEGLPKVFRLHFYGGNRVTVILKNGD